MLLDALTIIAESLASLLGDSLKDRLKPKASADKAKNKVYGLYGILRTIEKETDYYVENFVAYLAEIETEQAEDSLGARKTLLRKSVLEIWRLINELIEALNNINPQLEIHNYDLSVKIREYHIERSRLLDYQRLMLDLTESWRWQRSIQDKNSKLNKNSKADEIEELRKILSAVKRNQRSIKEIIHGFREFIAQEFSFKDSF